MVWNFIDFNYLAYLFDTTIIVLTPLTLDI